MKLTTLILLLTATVSIAGDLYSLDSINDNWATLINHETLEVRTIHYSKLNRIIEGGTYIISFEYSYDTFVYNAEETNRIDYRILKIRRELLR